MVGWRYAARLSRISTNSITDELAARLFPQVEATLEAETLGYRSEWR